MAPPIIPAGANTWPRALGRGFLYHAMEIRHPLLNALE
jgi:hypothetical protein